MLHTFNFFYMILISLLSNIYFTMCDSGVFTVQRWMSAYDKQNHGTFLWEAKINGIQHDEVRITAWLLALELYSKSKKQMQID